jgi:hypothetical protein
MLNVDGGDDVDTCIEDVDDVFPAFGVAGSGDVGVCQLIDEGDLRPAGEHGVEVHLIEAGAPIVDDASGDDLEVVTPLLRKWAPVAFDEADGDVGAPLFAPVTLVEHGVGLADPSRGSEVDAKVAGCFDDVGGVVHRRRAAHPFVGLL